MAAFKRSAGGEKLANKKRLQNDIETHTAAKVKPILQPRKKPGYPVQPKTQKKTK